MDFFLPLNDKSANATKQDIHTHTYNIYLYILLYTYACIYVCTYILAGMYVYVFLNCMGTVFSSPTIKLIGGISL